jgi:hypothetical protein
MSYPSVIIIILLLLLLLNFKKILLLLKKNHRFDLKSKIKNYKNLSQTYLIILLIL